jgi:hypothetical protein
MAGASRAVFAAAETDWVEAERAARGRGSEDDWSCAICLGYVEEAAHARLCQYAQLLPQLATTTTTTTTTTAAANTVVECVAVHTDPGRSLGRCLRCGSGHGGGSAQCVHHTAAAVKTVGGGAAAAVDYADGGTAAHEDCDGQRRVVRELSLLPCSHVLHSRCLMSFERFAREWLSYVTCDTHTHTHTVRWLLSCY